MNHFILFKLATRGNPNGFIKLIHSIIEKVSDKENYKILVSADIDDSTMYNVSTLNEIKHLIESKKVIICFDNSNSKIDAINRDMKLLSGWDILVNLNDNIDNINHDFDEEIRTLLLSQYPDKNGKVNFTFGYKDVIVMGKKYYDKQGFIIDNKNVNKFNHNLIVNYYTDKNEERTKELNTCFFENINNPYIHKVVAVCTENDYKKLLSVIGNNHNKLIPVVTDKRPTFNDYFALSTKLFNDSSKNINIISNLDIIISLKALFVVQINNSEKFLVVSDYLNNDKNCLALSRYDVVDSQNYTNGAVLFDRPDSQDTWIFRGGVNQISGADFTLGVAGCDNSIAHLLEQHGYNVINPSRTIKTYHLHLTNIRNYTDISGNAIERIPPPYKLIEPVF